MEATIFQNEVGYLYVRHFAMQKSASKYMLKAPTTTKQQQKKSTTCFAQHLDSYLKVADKAKDICKHMIISL